MTKIPIQSLFLFLLSMPLLMSGQNGPADRGLESLLEKAMPGLVEGYKYLHQHPELSLKEGKTAARLAEQTRALGYMVSEGVGKTGIVAVMRNGEGPTLLIRTDMDALPIVEATGLPYASTVQTTDFQGNATGAMHACGHDMHMSVWMGTATMMAQMKANWSGTLVMLGQPAEEVGLGAVDMLDDDLYSRFPQPDFALALHVAPGVEAGKIAVRPGYLFANADWATITVKGIGSHGAYPHQGIDPIVIASQIVLDLQTISSRNVDPLEQVVVTVGKFTAGTKSNIIPAEARLELTMRSYTPEVQQLIRKRIQEICLGAAVAAGLPEELYPVVEFPPGFTPSTYNDPALTEKVTASLEAALGEQNVPAAIPSMGAEDFSRYGLTEEQVPLCMLRLGTVSPERLAEAEESGNALPGLHSPFYYPEPEQSLRAGVLGMTTAALDLLGR